MDPKPGDAGEPWTRRMTLQFRLSIRFIVIVLVAGAILSIVTVSHIGNVLIQQVQNRVRSDLNSAHAVYKNEMKEVELVLRTAALAGSQNLVTMDSAGLSRQLELLRRSGEMDWVCLSDTSGATRACASPGGDQVAGATAALIEKVRSVADSATGTIVSSASLAQASTSRPAVAGSDQGGMGIAAAVPVFDANGKIVCILHGAKILNDRYEIVDAIRNQVFQGQLFHGKPIGTATIFQGDRRISTNVETAEGARAIGTRMSPEVAQAVLTEGRTYNAPAFVVNDWYITAYEPIRDCSGRIVGALYVGLLQAPFTQTRNTIVGGFLVATGGATLFILLLLVLVTRQVLHPIERIVKMSQRVERGDLSARVGIRPSGELGLLCQAVDGMADAVQQREEQLKLATRRQLSQSEKLASIGRLAAGIAHEVNNPLTGVLTFTHLLRGKANLDVQDRDDLDLVIRETTRVRDIVRGLLDFARESPSRKEWLDINVVIQQATRLLRGQKEFGQVGIEESLSLELPRVYGDQNQLQQLVLNLSLNACEAMPGGGKLSIQTAAGKGEVVVKFTDTGHGIRPEDVDKIFEPFFTTKPIGKGTGLGLSVSYGIVQQHGGTIEVSSEVGKGTTFTIVLPNPPAGGEAHSSTSPATSD